MTTTRAAAETIASARRSRVPLKALAREFAPTTEAEGYGIQEVLHDLLVAEFGAQVGYKIGCTSEMMQQYLAIPHPCAGGYSQAAFTTAASRLHLLISSASASNAKSPSGSRAILRLRKRPSPPISSCKRSRPTSQRSRSSMMAINIGRPLVR
jgi:hypothetical protein